MDLAEFRALLACEDKEDGSIRVKSRERTDLEFKSDCGENSLRKIVKTIAAFANAKGGNIIFGVTDSPRTICGVTDFPDDAELQDLLFKHLYPVPEVILHEHDFGERRVVQIVVTPCPKAPIVAIKDLPEKGQGGRMIMSQGVVYFRRTGQTKPISGEEFTAILERRDTSVRESILGLLRRAGEIGFEHVTIADFRKYGKKEENVTMWVPETAARSLNIVDRARLVDDGGAPAYQIRGSVQLTTGTSKDPRKPLLATQSARAIRKSIQSIFGNWFTWGPVHLRKAAAHLGFWGTPDGDGQHTGRVELTNTTVYFEEGRAAVERFANRNPDEFVDVVASRTSRAQWQRIKDQGAQEPKESDQA